MQMLRYRHSVLLLMALLFYTGNGYGHITHPCLMMVERLAASLKQCTSTRHDDHCRNARQALADQVRQCRKLAFTTEAIEEAIQEGEATVAGEGAAYHLDKTDDDSAMTAAAISKGNVHNFRQQFANVSVFPVEDLDYGAGQSGCHNAFLAAAGRYQFLGEFDLKRYRLNDKAGAEPYRLYFFSRMTEGVCYEAPQPDQTMENGDRVVLNLPEGFFPVLKQSTRQSGTVAVIVRCDNEGECTDKKRRALNLQMDYQATYLRWQRLQHCDALSSDNHFFPRITRLRFKKQELPGYCMEEDLEQNIQQLEATMKETEKALFEAL